MSPFNALLPKLTFITGPNGVGKTTLANLLFDEVPGLQTHSFSYPLRLATLGMFFDGNLTHDLTAHSAKVRPLPGFPSMQVRQFINALGSFVRTTLGEDALGILAEQQVKQEEEYFQHFVFDDLRRNTDLEPLMHEHPHDAALVIHLSRPGVSMHADFPHDPEILTRWHRVDLSNNGTPVDMLTNLVSALEAHHANI